MTEQAPMDRLQPCLLDRLTDHEPDKKNESRDRRVISMRQYRTGVLRDIQDLLNSRARPFGDEIYDYDEASKSVLNFGLRDLCGTTSSDTRVAEIEREVKEAILKFEPRILRKSLSVRIAPSFGVAKSRSISIEIEGELWAEPMSDHLFIKTEVDVETGYYDFGGTRNE